MGCSSDRSCPNGRKCCSNGCGRVCMSKFRNNKLLFDYIIDLLLIIIKFLDPVRKN